MPTERVLVVDDDPAILTLCHRILEADGYQVVEAKRGEDALAKLEQESFDLLLTDIRLPGLNGLDVTQRLRERNSELTVVTMTGYSNMEMAIQALSLGVDEFLVKPFTPESLRVHVTRALEKSRLRRENARLKTLVPLLHTAQSFAAGRTRENLYSQLFTAVKMLLGTNEIVLLDTTQNRGMVTCLCAPDSQCGELDGKTLTVNEWNRLAEFFLSGTRIWNESVEERLPFQMTSRGWMVGAPLSSHTETLGVVIAAVTLPPTPSDLDALRVTLAQAAAAMENIDLLGEISHAYVSNRPDDQTKTDFLNIAAHELRTPLATLRASVTALCSALQGEPRTHAAQVLKSVDRLQQIADNMVNLRYWQAGQADLRPEPCAVDEVLQQVVDSYQPLATAREQEIELAIDRASGTIQADRAMLDVILGSLISNALIFAPRHSHVRVAASGDTGQVTLSVQDEGTSLTPEQQAHLFDPKGTTSPPPHENGGMGLGLPLTRRMVDAHGGKIWVESESNRGTSFFISLPRDN